MWTMFSIQCVRVHVFNLLMYDYTDFIVNSSVCIYYNDNLFGYTDNLACNVFSNAFFVGFLLIQQSIGTGNQTKK